MASEPILGIDLGTSNSCVAVATSSAGAVVIPNRGHGTTPSVVAIAPDGSITVGHAAKRQVATNADNTFIALKRLIGRRFDEPEIAARAAQGLFESPNGDIRVRHHDRVYALAELNALILAELKAAAEAHLGQAVTKAVITVPAYFNDAQRNSTRDAGTIAGLEVVRMINEPTAAAVAYGYGRGLDKKVVVYDLGGGTFDISIVSCKADGSFEVLGTGGDTLLGGEDFDRLIAAFFAERFKREHGFDPPSDHATELRLKQAAEDAKTQLSMREIVEVDVPHLVVHPERGPLHLRCTLTRHVFDHKTKKLVARTIDLTRQALDEAKTPIAEVDDLLLVGGASRIPAIHHAVTALLGKKPSQRVHPDEAVALGAALVAHGLGAGERFAEGDPPPVRLRDRTPYTLGVRLRGNRREALVPKNTPLPTRVRRNFATTREGQTFVDVVVLQGESEVADECTLLADFRLDDIRPGPPGGVSLDLTLAVDENGVVSVTAMDVATQHAQSIRILASTDLSREDVARMAQAARNRQPGALAEPVAPVSAQDLFPADEPPSGHMPIHLGDAKGPSQPAGVAVSGVPVSGVSVSGVSVVPANVTQPIVQRPALATSVTQPMPQRPGTATTQPIVREARPMRRDPRAEEEEDDAPPLSVPRIDMLSSQPKIDPRIEVKPEPPRSGVPTVPSPAASIVATEVMAAAATTRSAVPTVPSPVAAVVEPAPRSGTPTVPSPIATLGGDLPPLAATPPRVSTAATAATAAKRSSAKPGGFRAQLKQLIASCEAAARTASVALASSDFATAKVEEGQTALARARAALTSEDEAAMRECAFELAGIEQTLTTLLA
ncbi:MAG: Hsp70 family protein [Labilithrix sp.]|nr:Hsp70 family protein [Labilithrix sp.]MCW5816340.1 Hsp70 family protein [Labilithrix sp.]